MVRDDSGAACEGSAAVVGCEENSDRVGARSDTVVLAGAEEAGTDDGSERVTCASSSSESDPSSLLLSLFDAAASSAFLAGGATVRADGETTGTPATAATARADETGGDDDAEDALCDAAADTDAGDADPLPTREELALPANAAVVDEVCESRGLRSVAARPRPSALSRAALSAAADGSVSLHSTVVPFVLSCSLFQRLSPLSRSVKKVPRFFHISPGCSQHVPTRSSTPTPGPPRRSYTERRQRPASTEVQAETGPRRKRALGVVQGRRCAAERAR